MNKQHILDEIRRAAAANDGRVLGRERFEKETGIKESDRRGKYWARWNDAVNEAGLSPNKLIAAYDDKHLLAKFAAFVRELSRFPTTSEMQLKRRHDADFPSQTVFDDWVGPQEVVFEALMIALNVVVRHELGDCVLKRGLSEEDHSVQALGFYGAHKALGERIQIR